MDSHCEPDFKRNPTLTFYFWNISESVGMVSTLTFGIPFLIWHQQQKSTNIFNKYKR